MSPSAQLCALPSFNSSTWCFVLTSFCISLCFFPASFGLGSLKNSNSYWRRMLMLSFDSKFLAIKKTCSDSIQNTSALQEMQSDSANASGARQGQGPRPSTASPAKQQGFGGEDWGSVVSWPFKQGVTFHKSFDAHPRSMWYGILLSGNDFPFFGAWEWF